MRRLRQQLARRLLPHDELGAGRIGELVGRIRLSEAELKSAKRITLAGELQVEADLSLVTTYLLQVQRSFDLGHMAIDIALQGRQVNGLAYGPCHLVLLPLAAALVLTSSGERQCSWREEICL